MRNKAIQNELRVKLGATKIEGKSSRKLLIKKRVALAGRGKSGGARTLVAFKRDDQAFFMYGFAKNQRSNIGAKEKLALKRLASELLGYKERQLKQALKHGALIEIEVKEND